MKGYMFTAVMLLLIGILASPMMAVSQGVGTEKGKQATTMGMEKDKGMMGKGMMKERGAMNLTDEQRELISKLHQTFREENGDTIKQLMIKHYDLETNLNSERPDIEKAKAIQKEISDLNTKLAQKRIDFYFELRKINPKAKFGADAGRDLGMRGMMGMGHGSE